MQKSQIIKKSILILDPSESNNSELPSTWEKPAENKIRFVVPNTSDEYRLILTNFDQTMKGKYTQIIRLERIQNERWYIQYLAHSRDFKKRLNTDTEKRLYHGCPEQAANSIIEGGFNRSYAGINGKSTFCSVPNLDCVCNFSSIGIALGAGVYFSSDASYSNDYAKSNASGERCIFVARVLIGRTTGGNSSMKTAPPGFDSTSSGNAFVTYHDAQAYAEYLIIYK